MSAIGQILAPILAALPGAVAAYFALRPLASERKRFRHGRFRFAAADLALLPLMFIEYFSFEDACGIRLWFTRDEQIMSLAGATILSWAWGIRMLSPFGIADFRRRAVFLLLVVPVLVVVGVGLMAVCLVSSRLREIIPALVSYFFLIGTCVLWLYCVNSWIVAGAAPTMEPPQERPTDDAESRTPVGESMDDSSPHSEFGSPSTTARIANDADREGTSATEPPTSVTIRS